MGIACHNTAQEMPDVGCLGKSSMVESPTVLASPVGTVMSLCHLMRGLITLTSCCSPHR